MFRRLLFAVHQQVILRSVTTVNVSSSLSKRTLVTEVVKRVKMAAKPGSGDEHDEVAKAQHAKKSEETIFGKIVNKQIKADIIYEDSDMMAFKDVNPQAPIHFLVIPKKPLATLDDAADEAPLLGKMLAVIPKLAKEQKLQDGYRVVINNGRNGAQSVFHLHVHVMGGRQMGWPPG